MFGRDIGKAQARRGRLVMIKALVLGTASLALSAGVASAQTVYPGYGYAPYGYSYGYDSGYGYAATAPLYDYAAPAYGYGAVAPGTAGTTVIIVTPGAPAYSAPPVGAGYYNYAPGYGGGYYGRAGYWGWR
jgi:hypothetical protein